MVKKQDLTDLAVISQAMMIDFVALPFTISADDIDTLREYLGPNGRDVKILAKIDSLDGVKNFDKIVQKADGSIFVRTDIQWEMQAEK